MESRKVLFVAQAGSRYICVYLDLSKGNGWCERGAHTPSLSIQTAPFGRYWYCTYVYIYIYVFVYVYIYTHVWIMSLFKMVVNWFQTSLLGPFIWWCFPPPFFMFKEDLNLANLECCRQILSINILFIETRLTAFFSFVCACVLRCLFDGKKIAGVATCRGKL